MVLNRPFFLLHGFKSTANPFPCKPPLERFLKKRRTHDMGVARNMTRVSFRGGRIIIVFENQRRKIGGRVSERFGTTGSPPTRLFSFDSQNTASLRLMSIR